MLTRQLRLLVMAVHGFSSLQLPVRVVSWASTTPELAPHAVRYLPLVGALVAALTAAVYAIMSLWLPHHLALLPALAAGLKMGRAIPEFGVAGFTDRMMLGDHAGTTEVSIGAAGALALVMLMLLRFTALSEVEPSWIGLTLVCGAAFSRGIALVPAQSVPGATLADRMIGFGLGVFPLLVGSWWTGEEDLFVAAGILSAVAALAVRRMARGHKLLDDPRCLDGAQQAAELAFLLGVVATLAFGDDETPPDPAS